MADLPAAGLISHEDTIEIASKTNFENLVDVLGQRYGYGPPITHTIESGSVSPVFWASRVGSETGSGDPDVLDTIDTAAFPNGMIISIWVLTNHTVTFNTQGNLILAGASSVTISADQENAFFILNAGTWFLLHVHRDDPPTARADLGLGTAATGTVASGGGLDADKCKGQHASDFALGTAGNADDAAQLQGIDGASFVEKASTSEQLFEGVIRCNDSTVGIQDDRPQLELRDAASIPTPKPRTLLALDSILGNAHILEYEADGFTIRSGFLLLPNLPPLMYVPGSGWVEIWGGHLGTRNNVNIRSFDVTLSIAVTAPSGIVQFMSSPELLPVAALDRVIGLDVLSMTNSAGGSVAITGPLWWFIGRESGEVFYRQVSTWVGSGAQNYTVDFSGTLTYACRVRYLEDI